MRVTWNWSPIRIWEMRRTRPSLKFSRYQSEKKYIAWKCYGSDVTKNTAVPFRASWNRIYWETRIPWGHSDLCSWSPWTGLICPDSSCSAKIENCEMMVNYFTFSFRNREKRHAPASCCTLSSSTRAWGRWPPRWRRPGCGIPGGRDSDTCGTPSACFPSPGWRSCTRSKCNRSDLKCKKQKFDWTCFPQNRENGRTLQFEVDAHAAARHVHLVLVRAVLLLNYLAPETDMIQIKLTNY